VRLEEANAALETRLDQRDAELEQLRDFKRRALSQFAAQHLEIERLRNQATAVGNGRRLSATRPGAAP
jgi:hypothetical protein